MARLFALPAAALLLLAAPALAQRTATETTYFPPPDARGGWRTASGADNVRKLAGLDAGRLKQAFEYASRTSQHGGLLVVRHGWLALEAYYGKACRDTTPAMASCGKALTSAACGALVYERPDLFPDGLDQKVFNERYLPEALPLDDPRKADITLGQLLTMAAGFHGEGSNPGFVNGEPAVALDPIPSSGKGIDYDAVHTPLWTAPGGGYSYASASPHVASMVLRRASGLELETFIDQHFAQPMGWGSWGWARHGPHANGGGDCTLRATDMLRFGYLLLHQGQWGVRRLIPYEYAVACARPSPYQRHAPFGLMFELNADGHVAAAPRDAFFKSGGGGFGICVIPSLDMVVYKMAGNDHQYDPAFTGMPELYSDDTTRDHWKPPVHTQFNDGPVGVDDGVRRTLEMVCAAVVPAP